MTDFIRIFSWGSPELRGKTTAPPEERRKTAFVKPEPITFQEFLVGQGVTEMVDREEFYQSLDRKCDDLETPGRWKRLVIADVMPK